MARHQFTTTLARLISRLQYQFRGSRDAIVLAVLGLVVGLCAGSVSIAFRAAIEQFQQSLLPGGGFSALSAEQRLVLPLIGVTLTLGLLYAVARGPVPSGVLHVLERLTHGSGRLPLRNAVVQFLAGSVVLVFGMSMGREGPAIHLGAACGSLVGERLRLDAAAVRTVLGCGVAAALGAGFNTPLAGVILAIEVVLIEYTVGGFTPVLLAAVTGATLGRLVYGDSPAFVVPEVAFGTLWELPYIVAMGLAIGAYAAAFISTTRIVMVHARRVAWWAAMLVAAVLVGVIACISPQVMGIGYDVIEATLRSKYELLTLVAVSVAKLVATAIGVGARLPAGLIGPTLVMGAAFGSVFGTVGISLAPDGTSNAALYAMLGMAAMMGATLQAPLSALIAVLELTGNMSIILPGMLAIMSATLATRHVFHCESIFTMQLQQIDVLRRP